nr:WD repeat-containing protein 54-like [Vicugna pacos]
MACSRQVGAVRSRGRRGGMIASLCEPLASGWEWARVWEIKVGYHPCRVPCPSVQLWQGTIAAGYGDGQVRLYEASTGTLHVQINAHAWAVCALDLAPDVGKLLSAAEDTFVHIWKLSRSPESGYIEVEHCHGECVPDTQVCGARFCDPSGSSFAVTGYDLAEILRFSSM